MIDCPGCSTGNRAHLTYCRKCGGELYPRSRRGRYVSPHLIDRLFEMVRYRGI